LNKFMELEAQDTENCVNRRVQRERDYGTRENLKKNKLGGEEDTVRRRAVGEISKMRYYMR